MAASAAAAAVVARQQHHHFVNSPMSFDWANLNKNILYCTLSSNWIILTDATQNQHIIHDISVCSKASIHVLA